MNRSILAMASALTLLVIDVGLAQETTDASLRIGTFDSRAVALAYYRSSEGLERMKPEWDQELRDAEAAGDSARVEELKLFMPSFQHLLHQHAEPRGAVRAGRGDRRFRRPDRGGRARAARGDAVPARALGDPVCS